VLRLTSLEIKKFRNVAPCTLEFGETFNVLLGKNATGKTTLLKLIVAAINGDFEEFEEPLNVRWTFERDGLTTDVCLEKERHATRVATTVGEAPSDEFAHRWRFEFKRGDTIIGKLTDDGSDLRWQPTDGEERSRAGLGEAYPSRSITAAATRLGADEIVASRFDYIERFDEALDQFQSIVKAPWTVRFDASGAYAGGRVSRLSLHNVDRKDLSDSATTSERDVRTIGPLLAKLPDLMGVESVVAKPHLKLQTTPGQLKQMEFDGIELRTIRGDEIVDYDIWSFGQKRLFAFFWHLTAFRNAPVVADELLNGLHHQWIEACVEELYARQSFLATQHPLLLDHIPIESAEGVKKTFIRCFSERGDDRRTKLVWRNFTEEEAARFYEAHQAGILHVSEVLKTEGLW